MSTVTKPKLVASASLHDPASDEQDKLFANDRPLITDFRFNSETATVFDDMVGRSVPFYSEMQRMVCELAADFATDGSNL